MMTIVIIGAGEVGCYIATLLSKEQHNIILIDKDAKKLQDVSFNLDVATRLGTGTDWQMLDDLKELSPDLLISLTDDDEVNLVACAIAKHLGYPRTIARVKDNRFLNRTRLDFGHIFDVDYFVGPELLVANEILKNMLSPGSVAVESFAHGAVQMRTLTVPANWRGENKTLGELELPPGMIVGLIKREAEEVQDKVMGWGSQLIFPHGDDQILPGDEVTFIGETSVVVNAHQIFGVPQRTIKSVTIVGGSLVGVNLAKLLEHYEIDVRLIEKDHVKCMTLADRLPHCTILNHDATDLAFFRSEKIGQSDVFVACTSSDEVNILSALAGKEVGCEEVVVMLSNASYAPIVGRMGLEHVVSPRVCAANHIMAQVLSGNVTSLVSMHENRAEIVEVNVSMKSQVVGIPLSELGPLLPRDFLIAVIQNRGRIMIANGNRIISPGDSVIVITHPRHLPDLEKIF